MGFSQEAAAKGHLSERLASFLLMSKGNITGKILPLNHDFRASAFSQFPDFYVAGRWVVSDRPS